MDRKLTPRERRFVALYHQTFNHEQAAQEAGYSEKSSRVTGKALITRLAVEIDRYGREELDKIGVDNLRTLREVALLAFHNPKDAFDENGNFKGIQDLGEMGRCIKAIKTKTDLRTKMQTHEITFYSKQDALDFLGKAGGMFHEGVTNALQVNYHIYGSPLGKAEEPKPIEVGHE